MSIQYDVTTRNAGLDAKIAAVGTGAILRIRSGAVPATCASPDFGVVLATLNLPDPWMLPAANGAISKTGTWQDLYADNSGLAGHFRIYTSAGVCRIQGTISASFGTGDLVINSVAITAGQYFKVTTFTINTQNA